jgi:hypothetical protein
MTDNKTYYRTKPERRRENGLNKNDILFQPKKSSPSK